MDFYGDKPKVREESQLSSEYLVYARTSAFPASIPWPPSLSKFEAHFPSPPGCSGQKTVDAAMEGGRANCL